MLVASLQLPDPCFSRQGLRLEGLYRVSRFIKAFGFIGLSGLTKVGTRGRYCALQAQGCNSNIGSCAKPSQSPDKSDHF